jgi:PAS domain S-box-containing protein
MESLKDTVRTVRTLKGKISQPTQSQMRKAQQADPFSFLFQNNPQPMWIYDLETLRFLEVNEAAVKHYGYARAEFLKMRITDIRPEEDAARVIKHAQARRPRLQQSGEWRHLKKDGTLIHVDIVSHTLIYKERKAVLVVVRDITEQKRVGEALGQSESSYRSLFENIPDGMYRSTPRGRFISVNPALVQMLGYETEEQLLGVNIQDLYANPKDRKRNMGRVNASGESKNIEFDLKRRDGQVITVLENVRVIKDARGRVRFYEGALTDITERKQAEEALRKSEERFRGLYENTTIGIYRTTPDGQILMSNPALVKMLEYDSFEELASRNLDKNGSNAMYSRQEFKEVIEREGTILGREATWKTKNGKILYVRENTRAVCDEQGKVLCYEGTVEDITELKKAEEALRASEGELQAIFSAIPDLIMVVDQEGRCLKIMSSNAELKYHPMEDFPGKRMHDIFSRTKADQLLKHIRRTLRTRQSVRFEYTLPAEEKMLWFSAITAPLTKDTVVWAARDITAQKRIEEETQRRLIELQALYESGLTFSRTLDVNAIGEQIIHILEKHLYWHHAAVRLRGEDSDEVEVIGLGREGGQPSPAMRRAINKITRVGQGLSGWVLEHGEAARVGDLTKDARYMEIFSGIKSGLYVPMKTGEITIGVISVESEKADAFDENDERLLTTLASQAAAAIQNARLFRQTQRRAMESAVLSEVTGELAALNDVPALLQTIANSVTRILDVPGGSIYLYDATHTEFEIVASTDPDLAPGTRLHTDEGAAGRVAQTHEAIIIEDYRTWEGAAAQYKEQPFYSVLSVPMLYRGELTGVLAAHGAHATSSTKENNRKFTDRDARLLSLFASAAAGAVYSARLLEAERKRRQEAETLQKAASALTSSLNMEQILNVLLDELAELIPSNSSSVFITEGTNIRLVAKRGHDSRGITGRSFPLEDSMEKYVFELRAPLILPDAQSDPRFHAFNDSIVIHSWMGLPLIARDKIIGSLALSSDQPNAFDESQVRLAMAIANQAAAAIENARLFQDTLEYTRKWATLHAASQQLARIQEDIEQVYNSIHQAAAKLVPAEIFTISLLDEKRGQIDGVYLYDRAGRSPVLHFPPDAGFSGKVIQSGIPIKIDDDLQSNIEGVHFGSAEVPRSLLAVPLRVSDKIIGVISVQSYEPNMYDAEDRLLLELLASQAAIAIENARLFESTRQSASQFSSLYETALDMAKQQDPNQILNMIVERTAGLLNVPVSGIYLHDEARKDVYAAVSKGFESSIGIHLAMGEGAAGRVAQSRQAMIIEDYQTWEGHSLQYDDSGLRAVLEVPMIYAGKLIGVLTAAEQGDSTRKFTEEEAHLLALFASDAASAVYNARLLTETQQRAHEFEMLYETTREISLHQQDATSLLKILVERAAQLLNAQGGGVYIYDRTRNDLEIAATSGDDQGIGQRVKFGEGAAGRVAETRKPIMIEDYLTWEHRTPAAAARPYRALVSVPMIYSGEMIGVLDVFEYGENERQFSEKDVQLLSLLAAHAASAIHNVRLFDETRRRAQEFKALYETSRDISTQQKNSGTLLQTIVERAIELLHSKNGGFYLYDAERQELELAFFTEMDLKAGTRLKLGEGAAGRVALSREPLIIDDYQTWEGHSPQYQSVPFRAILQVPMLYGGELIGVLVINEYGDSERKFTREDANLLTLFAAHASSVVYNARLFEQLEERVEQFSTLHSIDMVIGSTTDLRISLQMVLESILHLLKVDAADILLYHSATLSLEYENGMGFHSDTVRPAIRLGEKPAGQAALTRQIVELSELGKANLPPSFQEMIQREGFVAYRGLPVIAKGEVKGVLEIYQRSPLPSHVEWNDLLHLLAGQAAIAMDNAMLFDNLEHVNAELQIAYDATIEGWSQAVDLWDNNSSDHIHEMVETTISLAQKMGIPESDLPNIRRGVLLHDVGKMGTPDQILLKPGALDEEEWKVIRQHPINAYNLLSKIAYLRSALDIPYCHHEKWDGSGYPRGLKAEQIPLAARIFAVVDVGDALEHDRPYRAAWPKEKISEYLKEQAGKQFDPRAVEAYLETL